MITYVKGDSTQPQGLGVKIIAHIVNDKGKWGAGFVLALSKRDSIPEQAYRVWHSTGRTTYPCSSLIFEPGAVQYAPFLKPIAWNDRIWVANMVAQHETGILPCEPCEGTGEHGDCIHCNGTGGIIPLRYEWLKRCLLRLNDCDNATIHMPRIGCGLAGGSWNRVEDLIESIVTLPVTVYDL